ncbi:hypothetical protein DERF_011247 [Dermatophagoides farinae]|uniref:Uncharacterized protein n=1 Tax=Dermatophagoides farinae TaxID=6954 RepID=A0A922HSJ9_DERFA|nr:hypothetical protein DERF_011247 [Dermatophagoides farinae]
MANQSLRQSRMLSYIAEFTTDLSHISGITISTIFIEIIGLPLAASNTDSLFVTTHGDVIGLDAEEVDGFELDGPDVDDVDAHDFHPKSVSDTHQ